MKLSRFQLFFQAVYLKFAKYIFDKGEEDIKPLLEQQTKDMKNLLNEVSNIMSTYKIENNIMSMSESEQRKEKNRLDKVIKDSFKSQYNAEQKQITSILNETGQDKYDSNSYLFTLDKQNKRKRLNTEELKKIISQKVEGKNYSERLWTDKNQVASTLQNEIKKFMQGKTNVNDIKEVIQKRFGANENNTKRIVSTEIARVQSAVSDKWCKENGIEYQLFSIVLDGVTSKVCQSHANDKPYKVDDPNKPIPPLHPFCRSTLIPITPEGYTPNIPKDDVSWKSFEEWENSKERLVMDLQLFSHTKDKNGVIGLIKQGLLDKDKFNDFRNNFNKLFKEGIDTPLEKVKNSNDRAYHVAFRHKDLMNDLGLKNIEETLKNPDIIRKAIDINGSENNGYIKAFNNKILLVIANGDIITSYYPSKNYIKNRIEGWDIIWDKK